MGAMHFEGTARVTPGRVPAGAPRAVHFPAFDGLRAIAALSVVVYHVALRTGSLDSFLGSLAARGEMGVSIFFLISGFLLYRPFVTAGLAGHSGPDTVAYFSRRFLRIFPAYWVALVAVTLLLDTGDFLDARAVFTSFTLTFVYVRDSFQTASDGLFVAPISQAWSLCVELAFYVFLPLYAALLRRGGTRLRKELTGVGVLFAVGFLADWAFHGSSGLTSFDLWLWLPRSLDHFALGMLLAIVSARTASQLGLSRVLQAVAGHPGLCWAAAGVLFLVVARGLGLQHYTGLLERPTTAQHLLREQLYGAVAFCLLLPAVFGDGGRVRRFLCAAPTIWLGLVSYGIYLWHQDLLTRVLERVGPETAARFAVTLSVTVTLTVAAAALSWYLVERPAQHLRSRLSR